MNATEIAKAKVLAQLELYINHLQTLTDDKVTAVWGTKYWKIVFEGPIQKHVHSFVDRETGDVLKAASWAKPAKDARYNLLTSFDELVQRADPYGSYLYKR